MAPAFELSSVIKNYPDFCLGPLDFCLEPGTVLGYVGPNGAGKTTTLHCLVGLVKPDEGHIRIGGQSNDPKRPAWRHDIGYVGDRQVFFDHWSGARNLDFLGKFYPYWSRERTATLSKRLRLPLEKKVKDLSGGNRVKLALVAALAQQPQCLLMDEPTSGLDPVVRAEVLDLLFAFMEPGNRAILYSTHILSDIARLADKLAFLNEGKLLYQADATDLTERWRRFSFRYGEPCEGLTAVVAHRREDANHQVVSSDAEATLAGLQSLGAENIQATRMPIEEITVHILKGDVDVEHS